MKPIYDLHRISERQRIAMIAKAVSLGQSVAFMVDKDGSKGDRYISKLREINSNVTVEKRFDGPVVGVETIKVVLGKQN